MWPLKTGFHSFLLNLRHFNATILIFYPSFCDVPEEGSLFSLVNSLRDLNHNTGFILQLWSCLLGRKGETVPPSPPMHPRKQPSALLQGHQHPLPPQTLGTHSQDRTPFCLLNSNPEKSLKAFLSPRSQCLMGPMWQVNPPLEMPSVPRCLLLSMCCDYHQGLSLVTSLCPL